jgi:hypothetical protein
LFQSLCGQSCVDASRHTPHRRRLYHSVNELLIGIIAPECALLLEQFQDISRLIDLVADFSLILWNGTRAILPRLQVEIFGSVVVLELENGFGSSCGVHALIGHE